MIINNSDLGKLIYDEARHSYPELFHSSPPAVPPQTRGFDDARLLPAVYGGLDPLPPFLTRAACHPFGAVWPCKPYPPFDVTKTREDFPILGESVNGRRLVWLDNAATTQKPKCVIDRLRHFYEHENSNIHRAAHTLARRATESYEGARRTIASFLNVPDPDAIVFVRGATEGINLAASSYGLTRVKDGDEILITQLEHHANIVPWQLLCKKTGARLRVAPVDDSGQVILEDYQKLLTARTKIAAFAHVSNVLGTITPAAEMIRLAHRAGAVVLVDGAQAVAHLPVDVTALDCDFYVFSGHKLFGPTGIGVLYGKPELLEEMAPYQGGGSMITAVTPEESRFKAPPHRFEAGTGNIAGALGLARAADYVSEIGLDTISRYEHALVTYATEMLRQLPDIAIIGGGADKAGIVSFDDRKIGSEELASLLDREGIAVRAGHHCAQPILARFSRGSVVRASLALYNTYDEIDMFFSVLSRIKNQY
jgi:cysteine desulfurase/selenocysteine lyase